MSDAIPCTYHRDGWRIVGRGARFDVETPPLAWRHQAETAVMAAVLARTGWRQEEACFAHAATEESP